MRARIFIPSKGRAQTIRTHLWFPSSIVVVHTEQERKDYLSHHPELQGRLAVSGAKMDTFGLTRQREFVCTKLAKPDEWFVFADDNIRHVIAVSGEHYKRDEIAEVETEYSKENARKWRAVFNAPCDEERFLGTIIPDMIAHCQDVGAHLAGFSLTDNIVFRRRKFLDISYVIGKMMLWHNVAVPFNHTVSMEDFYHTATHIKTYGVAVTNNFVAVRSGHYQPGGMGTYEERKEIRKRDVVALMSMFPGMFRVKHREGFELGTDITLVLHSSADVQAWKAKQSRRLV